MQPRRLHLDFDESASNVEDKIVSKTIPYRSQHSPAALQCLKYGGLFRNVSRQLCIQVDSAD